MREPRLLEVEARVWRHLSPVGRKLRNLKTDLLVEARTKESAVRNGLS